MRHRTSSNCWRTIWFCAVLMGQYLRAEWIWIEGEAADERNVTRQSWYDDVRKDGMSGQEWISHYNARQPGTATYRFEVKSGGDYVFWWRGNVLKAEVSYQLDGGAFQPIRFADKRGEYQISPQPDHRRLAWVKVGTVNLPPGPHALTFRFHSSTFNHGGIDCFLFSNEPFVPSGALKPAGRGATAKPDEWFPAVFDDDPLSPRSVIDMSALVEAPAGMHGFLQKDGEHLRFENADAPVKFWGCGANFDPQLTRAEATQRIRWLRKYGVNLVRHHPVFSSLGPLQDGRLDPGRVDEFDWWFAELKKHGLYYTWSLFYPLEITPDDGYPRALFDELEPGKYGRRTYGLVNMSRALQDLQLRYLTAVLQHRNPYTGLRYVEEPALAVLEIQNEDCIFFHNPLSTLQRGQLPEHARLLRRMWCDWVKARYGTAAGVRQAWGGLRPGESLAAGELGLFGAFHLAAAGPVFDFKGQTRRAGDFIRFLTEMQKEFYDRREKEMRALGFKGVTVTTAWRAGGAAADPANLYCDTSCDMIDRHNYFGGGDGHHVITTGKVNPDSHLARPGSGLLALGLYQVEQRPFSVSEWSQMPPDPWKVEAAPLIAFYGLGLQGWDASYHFVSSRHRFGDGWPSLSKYVTDTPHYLGQFPALAFALHHGHIQEAPVAAARRLPVDALFRGVDPLGQDFTGGGWDNKTLAGCQTTPMEVLAIGRVTVGFEGGSPQKANWDQYWDKGRKLVRSMTGELTWDYGRQIVTLAAPRTQAILGRAGGQTIDLPGVKAQIATPFVSLLFTPLDNAPLAVSRHILITAMARDTQTGAELSADGTQLTTLGGPPLLMEPVQASLWFKGAKPVEVKVLDLYGGPTGRTVAVGADGGFHIDGTYRTYYYEVKR